MFMKNANRQTYQKNSKQSLDYEKRDEYNLVVKVSNKKPLVQGAKTSNHDEANIKIKVLDVNEPPVLLEDSKNVQGFFVIDLVM